MKVVRREEACCWRARLLISFSCSIMGVPSKENHTFVRFARLNPKMLVPSMKLDDGTIVNDSRVCMKVMDKNCPKDQEEKVERILDIAYSCDLGWYSTVPLKKKVWLWYLMQESGLVSFKVLL